MNLDRVTFTGADESVRPKDLFAISAEWPFVEWGILFSLKHQGGSRYPSQDWLQDLILAAPVGLNLSAHLCGKWVRDLVIDGTFTWNDTFTDPSVFDRVQLNFHAEPHQQLKGFERILNGRPIRKPFILQCDGVHDEFVREYVTRSRIERNSGRVVPLGLGAVVPLFDASGGAGRVPGAWPQAWPGIYCGYAGGLGPENIVEQLERIAVAAAGEARIWIDMERRVRSADDTTFDLDKVTTVLKLVTPFIGRPHGIDRVNA